jgi:heme exporter protein D
MSDFLAMGGHAPFVWGSYAVALLVLAGLGLVTWRRVKTTRDTLAKLEAARPRRRRDRTTASPRAVPSPARPVREAATDDA